MNLKTTKPANITTCFHCGDECNTVLHYDEHAFCCVGCKNVYELLSNNNLCSYYSIENTPGKTQINPVLPQAFDYLLDEKVEKKLLLYKDNSLAKVTFFIPAMHCSSCIWLLEHLYKINSGILQTKVNFLKKELMITFNPSLASLKDVVVMLSSIGYEPAIRLNDIEKSTKKEENKKLFYQIGVAGFCFGNIMLISFPEYFGLDSITKGTFSKLFGWLNLVLSLPVFFYSAQDYFKTAWVGIKKRFVNIEIPLALGILTMFVRSTYEVVTGNGIGWFDTLAGLVFFLLIGKWLQQRTFETLSFERDYKSYFPVAVTLIKGNEEIAVPVTSLEIGDRIKIRNNELIPADAILLNGDAQIDFSFVTGESVLVNKVLGEIVYAGGRQKGTTIELEICKKVSQSYLTQLWNNEAFSKPKASAILGFQQKVSKYFTIVLLLVATLSAVWWLVFDVSLALNAFTAVLIIACPCALALSSPFALGTAMQILGKNKFYVKSTAIVEYISHINTIVFDKTGTLTLPSSATIQFEGKPLSDYSKQIIASMVAQSIHPLSQKIKNHLQIKKPLTVTSFNEIAGKGIEGRVDGVAVKIGSSDFVGIDNSKTTKTKIFVSIDNQYIGFFEIGHTFRKGLRNVINELKQANYSQYLLSGDTEKDSDAMLKYFDTKEKLFFNQSPADKLNFIDKLQRNSSKVMMIGDGLNDAGALKKADIGISVTEDTSHFSPASDVIMDASVFEKLPAILRFTKNTRSVIHASFVLSLLYNLVGLSYAVQGTLSPLIAAILMPISSVSVIIFTTLVTTYCAKKGGLQ